MILKYLFYSCGYEEFYITTIFGYCIVKIKKRMHLKTSENFRAIKNFQGKTYKKYKTSKQLQKLMEGKCLYCENIGV